jgi:DNA-binding transcriptional regulator YiaG
MLGDAMTPQQFKEARLTLALSTAQLATILNTDARTIRRWESMGSDARKANPIACRVIQWLLDGKLDTSEYGHFWK